MRRLTSGSSIPSVSSASSGSSGVWCSAPAAAVASTRACAGSKPAPTSRTASSHRWRTASSAASRSSRNAP